MPKREKRSLPKDGKRKEQSPSPSAQGKEFQLPEDEIGDIVDDAVKGTEQELASNKQTNAE